MASMEACSPYYSSKRNDGSSDQLSLKEWAVKSSSEEMSVLEKKKSKSRRHSASYIRTTSNINNDESNSFTSYSNIAFSSATSSPAYPFKDHGIDPSTYSFNSALKALQGRSCYNNKYNKNWECLLSPDGLALNSKWNEAEKYICNPLSGEVPIECLSSKALISARSFRKSTLTNKVNIINNISDDHDPNYLLFSSTNTTTSSSSTNYSTHQHHHESDHLHFPTTVIPEKKMELGMTRDVGIQSTSPPEMSSGSPSPASTPSIKDKSLDQIGDSSPSSNQNSKFDQQVEQKEKEKEKERENTQENMDGLGMKEEEICSQGGCFSWMKKKKLKEKGRQRKINIFLTHC